MLGRLKYDLDELIDKMFDQLPSHNWSSKTTTFLDPSIGGGQFIKKVIERLTDAGHSMDNIKSRVWGFAENQFALNYAVARHNLVGTFKVGSVEEIQKELQKMKKFDVVCSNYPFQSDANNSDNNLWVDFHKLVMTQILKPQTGIALVISPQTWIGKNKQTSKADYSPYRVYQIDYVEIFDRVQSDKYFKGVGSTFTWYVTQACAVSRPTKVVQYINGEPTDPLSVNFKFEYTYPKVITKGTLALHELVVSMSNQKKLDIRKCNECHGQQLKKKDQVRERPSKRFPYPVYYSHRITRYTSVQSSIYAAWKVMIPKTGALKDAFVDRNCNVNEDVRYILAKSKAEAVNILSLLRTNLFQWIGATYRTGRVLEVYELPIPWLDCSQPWSNERIIKELALSIEQQQIINEHELD
jgi:hypothetical protein